jgi:Mg-chelatase subunit ChlD
LPNAPGEPEIKFQPPESVTEEGDGAISAEGDWELAVRFHESKKRLEGVQKGRAEAKVVRAILRKAQATMGAMAKPFQLRGGPWETHPAGELDLDTTLEEEPQLDSLWTEVREAKRAEVIVCIDTSLSMTGKKLALTAVALAVIGLQLDPEDFAIIAFESQAERIKGLGEALPLSESIRRFLEVPARGLTNIEEGLKMAKAETARGKRNKQVVILMTDGRFTAGRNPDYLVPGLPQLHVVQTGNPWSSPRFCREMARKGRGQALRVSRIEQLPQTMYSLVSRIIR